MTAIFLQPSHDRPGRLRHAGALDALNDAAGWVLATLRRWRERSRGRAQLAALDDRMLCDIGLTRGDREYLANKPFWKE